MSTGDTLAQLCQKVTDAFAGAIGGQDNADFAFLTYGVPVPDDMVQNGMVNPAQVAAFLSSSFDAPYLLSPGQGKSGYLEGSYGYASAIFCEAVALSQPTASPSDSNYQTQVSEIAAAKNALPPGGLSGTMQAHPDDWMLPGATNYWASFDSASQTTSVSLPSAPTAATTSASAPASASHFSDVAAWSFKPALKPIEATTSTSASTSTLPASAKLIARIAMPIRAPLTANVLSQSPPLTAVKSEAITNVSLSSQTMIAPRILTRPLPVIWHLPPPPSTPPQSTVEIQFEFVPVTIGYWTAAESAWNSAFLAYQGWCIPGMKRGGLLPDPNLTSPGSGTLVYGRPTTLFIVRNLVIKVSWTGDESALIGETGGYIGPFSLQGAKPIPGASGQLVQSCPGMQVVALNSSRLPVLPPVDASDVH